MIERILLMSGNRDWREGLVIELPAGTENCETEFRGRWREIGRRFNPTAIVLHTENPGHDEARDQPRSDGQPVMRALREAFPAVPLLLVTAVPNQRLSDFASACPPATVLFHQDTDPAKLAAEVLVAAARLRPPPEPPQPATWGLIEIVLGQNHIECVVQAGGHTDKIGPLDWDRRDVEDVEKDFERFENDNELFRTKVDQELLQSTGRRLLRHSFEQPLKQARAWCEQHMIKNGTLYHRFTVTDGDLKFVPLELVATGNDGQYLRSVCPVARRLKIAEQHGYPDRERSDSGVRILFILADAEGSLSLRHSTFKKQESIYFNKLEHIHNELKEMVKVYGKSHVRLLRLKEGRDAKKAIVAALRDRPYDVVHFAGHSVRADATNDVFLILPGLEPQTVVEYNVEDFAKRAAGAGVRLVILSSCEGASCRSISRLASFGIPAVAGFRWKVDDCDAASFTAALYRELRRSNGATPLVHAFHEALQVIKEHSQELSWLSPVLVLQPLVWHDFKVEV